MEQKKPSSNCKVHGYTEYVYQSNGYFYCSTCRNDAIKKWREKNRAHVYEYRKKYIQDNPHIKKKWGKKYYEKNKEKMKIDSYIDGIQFAIDRMKNILEKTGCLE